MKSLTRYAFTNSRIRALLSLLLTNADYKALVQAQDLTEWLEIIKETAYGDDFADLTISGVNSGEIERCLERRAIQIHKKILRNLTGVSKEVVFLLLSKYEIRILKQVLRHWHKKDRNELPEYLSTEKICYHLPLADIVRAANLEEIIILLDHTPYKQALLAARANYKKHNSVFYLEVNLDMDFYQRLREEARKLDIVDRKQATRLLGIEIDSENISWLLRFKEYYKLPVGEVIKYLIPGGYQIKEQLVRSVYPGHDSRSIVNGLAVKPYQEFANLAAGENATDHLSVLEALLRQIMFKEARHVLAGWPFSIGTILSYLILLQIETKNIISLYYSKLYEYQPASIEANLLL